MQSYIPSTESVPFFVAYPASLVALHEYSPLSGGSVLKIFSVLDVLHWSGRLLAKQFTVVLIKILVELVSFLSFFSHWINACGIEVATQIKVTLLDERVV